MCDATSHPRILGKDAKRKANCIAWRPAVASSAVEQQTVRALTNVTHRMLSGRSAPYAPGNVTELSGRSAPYAPGNVTELSGRSAP